MQSTGRKVARPAGKRSGSSDLALVQRVKQGDRSAFDLLVVKYQHKILNLIMRYVKDSLRGDGRSAGGVPEGLSCLCPHSGVTARSIRGFIGSRSTPPRIISLRHGADRSTLDFESSESESFEPLRRAA